MATMRRDVLKRMAEAGKLETVSTYHFDDMQGTSIGKKALPVRLTDVGEYWTRQEGICYLFPSDFSSSCGHAKRNDDGTIDLYVHGNSWYTFRVVKEARHG